MRKLVFLGALLLVMVGCASGGPPTITLVMNDGSQYAGFSREYTSFRLPGFNIQAFLMQKKEAGEEVEEEIYLNPDEPGEISQEQTQAIFWRVRVFNPRQFRFRVEKVILVESCEKPDSFEVFSHRSDFYEGDDRLRVWKIQGPNIIGRKVVIKAIFYDEKNLPIASVVSAPYEVR